MLSDEVIDKVVERLTNRIEQVNTYVLTQIGKKIKQIYNMTPSEAQKLIQVLKYGGDYEKITRKLAEITKLNIKDIKKIFEEIARNDYDFAKQFYDFRNKKYIPFEQNKALQRQIEAIRVLTENKYIDLARTKALGFSIRNNKGKVIFKGLKQVYNEAIDKAVLSVVQGKDTFYNNMHQILKDIGESGLKTLDYKSGRTLRLDSAIRMHMEDAIKQLHNETQKQIGEEFDSDGVEITVHLNPAPDHELVQGRQFSTNKYDKDGKLIKKGEFEKFQDDEKAISYDGIVFEPEFEGHDRRSISELNCKHYTFSIILGVNIPQYSNEQLQQIIDRNDKGFDFEGKHYTMYDGAQLQRQIEREIRKQKDLQMFGLTSGDDKLVRDSQYKIRLLNRKYKQLSKESGLLQKLDRLRVSGYRPVKVIEKPIEPIKNNIIVNNKSDLLTKWDKEFKNDNITVKHILNAEPKLIDKQITQVDKLLNKYDFVKESINNDFKSNELTFQVNTPDMMGEKNYARFFGGHYIEFNEKYFKDTDLLYNEVKEKINKNWWQKVETKNYEIYPTTHEFGHLLEFKMIDKMEYDKLKLTNLSKAHYINADDWLKNKILSNIKNGETYLSDYGKSQKNFEWFAETFAQMELGNGTPLTKELKKYIDEFMEDNYEYFR